MRSLILATVLLMPACTPAFAQLAGRIACLLGAI